MKKFKIIERCNDIEFNHSQIEEALLNMIMEEFPDYGKDRHVSISFDVNENGLTATVSSDSYN